MDTTSFPLESQHMHKQLCLVTGVLASFVRAKPRSLTLEQISHRILRSQTEMIELCDRLETAGLLIRDTVHLHAWRIPNDRPSITLWDIYLLVTEHISCAHISISSMTKDQSLEQSIELQWMLAALASNQIVANQLRRFSLDSIVMSARVPLASDRPEWNWNVNSKEIVR